MHQAVGIERMEVGLKLVEVSLRLAEKARGLLEVGQRGQLRVWLSWAGL